MVLNDNIFSRNEILQHNKKDDCWIIVYNEVYDITELLKIHPGGSEILLARAGEDASTLFQTRHDYNRSILKRLEKYKIGILPKEERIDENAFKEPFLDELIKICHQKNLYEPEAKAKRKFDAIRWSGVLLILGIIYLIFYLKVDWQWAIPLVIIQSLIAVSMFGLIAHEHTHRELTESKVIRYLLIFVWPILWPFISRKPLIYEHNSHHIKIGDPEHDYEVIGFSHFLRYSAKVEHRAIHNIQHFIAWFWYMFYANIITTIGGILTPYWKSHNKSVALRHNASLLITILAFFIFPVFIHGFQSAPYFIGMYLIYQCILFMFIYLGSAINHFTPMANTPIPDEMKNKFGYYVCHNSSNFSPKSTFWFYFSGGFNLQIEHHLNAFVPVENLRKLKIVVENLCKKYQYPYIEYSSLWSLYKDHYNYLYTLSKPDTAAASEQEILNKDSFQAR